MNGGTAQEPHERIKWVEFCFLASRFLTADAEGRAGRARSRAARGPPWRPPPLLLPPTFSDLADPGHELLPPPQPPKKRRNGRVGRQCSSRGDRIADCGVCRTVLRRPGSRRHAAESDEHACVRRGKSGVEEERTREYHCAACLVVVVDSSVLTTLLGCCREMEKAKIMGKFWGYMRGITGFTLDYWLQQIDSQMISHVFPS